MSDFLQQLFSLFSTYPGLLAYHLIIGFSIVAALLASLNLWQSGSSLIVSRQAFGLGLLFILQVILFVSAALAWQKLISAGLALPSITRGVELLSFLIIIWLWAYPYSTRWVDLVFCILGLTLFITTCYVIIWQNSPGFDQVFIGSFLERVSLVCGVGLALVGMFILIVLRPAGWANGYFMIVILGAGYLFQLLFPQQGEIFSGWQRLSQLIAYPLLVTLSLRFGKQELVSSRTPQASPGEENTVKVATAYSHIDVIDPVIQPVLLSLIDQRDSVEIGYQIAEAIAQGMSADFCLLAFHDIELHTLEINFGYDLVHKHRLSNISINSSMLDVLMPILLRGDTVRLPSNSTVPDLQALASALSLIRTGSMLAAPLPANNDPTGWLVFVLSPYTGRSWLLEDENHLIRLAGPLIKLIKLDHKGLGRSDKMEMLTRMDRIEKQTDQGEVDLAKKLHPIDDGEVEWKLEIEP